MSSIIKDVEDYCELPQVDKISLSEEQKRAVDYVSDFIKSGHGKYIVIGGQAGTGKSSIIPYIMERQSPYSVKVVAYTGKAVVVLKRKGIVSACTLHSFLYKPKAVEDANGESHVEFINKEKGDFYGVSLVIVDEASMVDRSMFERMNELPFKVVYIGDHFQLPPVKDDFNIMEKPDFVITKILRQLENDPIIQLAEMARNGKNIPYGKYGKSRKMFGIKPEWLPLYSQIITWTNNKKDEINDAVRILKGIKGITPLKGEKMIIKVNHRGKNVFNGQMIYLISDAILSKRQYKIKFIDELAHDDIIAAAKAGPPTTAKATLRLSKEDLEKYKKPYDGKNVEDYRKYKALRDFIHLDYGYAITCHSAQGSSWENVCIIDEPRFRNYDSYSRWLYTAITRAEKTVTICSGDTKIYF